MTAAVGLQRPERIFCRETALVLYGVPLIAVPRAVHIRAMGTSEVGTRPLCGNLQTQAIQRRMPLRALAPPVPRGDAAEEVRQSYWRAVRGNTHTVEVPGITYDNGAPARVKVEPLAMALIDTVPRMGKQEAVVALDAVFAAGADSRGWLTVERVSAGQVTADELMSAQQWLWSQRARSAWTWAAEFANPLSESPGESRSRVLIDELGFATPELQNVVRLADGSVARLDFEWPADGVVGEFDGRIKFTEAARLSGARAGEVYWNQVRREEALRDTGRRVARWGWDDLADPRRLEVKLLREGVSRKRPR